MRRAKLIIFLLSNILGAQISNVDNNISPQKSWLATKVIALVSSEIESRTGLKMNVEGGLIELSNQSITLYQVNLGESLITIPKAQIKISFLDFLKGGVGIDSILIDQPTINLSKQTRSRLQWKSQTADVRFNRIPKIIISSGVANNLDQSMVLRKGIYRFNAVLYQGQNGYVNFTGESRFTLDPKNKSDAITLKLVGELSSNNYLTTRIFIESPSIEGSGDGQIHLETGEARYSLYTNTNLLRLMNYTPPFLKSSNIKTIKTAVKVNRTSKESDWKFFIDSELRLGSIYTPIQAQLNAHIPNNLTSKHLKLDYAQIKTGQGVIRLSKVSEGIFAAQIKQYPFAVFENNVFFEEFDDVRLNATGEVKVDSLSVLNEFSVENLKGDFVSNAKNIGRFDIGYKNRTFFINNLSFKNNNFSLNIQKDLLSPSLNTNFILKSNLKLLRTTLPWVNQTGARLTGDLTSKGTLVFDNTWSIVNTDFEVHDLNIDSLFIKSISGKLSITPQLLNIETIESQEGTRLSGALAYPLGDPKGKIKGHLSIIESDFRQILKLWGLNSIIDSSLTGRLEISGIPSQIHISSSLNMDSPRWFDYLLPPLSFRLTYDQNRQKLGISDFRTTTLNRRSSSPTDSTGLKGEALFNLKEGPSYIKINGDLKSTLLTGVEFATGFIDVDLHGDLNRAFGYGSYPMGLIKITPYSDSKKKLGFLYQFDGNSLLLNLDDMGLGRRLLEVKGSGSRLLSQGTFSFKQIDNRYFSYFLNNSYFERLFGSATLEMEGSFTSKPSTFDYSINISELSGILDHYSLDKKQESNLRGNQEYINVNLSFANSNKNADGGHSFFSLSGLVPLNSSTKYNLRVSGQSTIEDLTNILTSLNSTNEPLVNQDYELGGKSLYQIKVTGDMDNPKLEGVVEVQSGYLAFEKNRFLDRFNGKINLLDQHIYIDPTHPMEGDLFDSSVTISGRADWTLKEIEKLSILAQAKNLNLQNLPGWEGLRVRADASLDLQSSPSGKLLSGDLKIHELFYEDKQQLFEDLSFGARRKSDLLAKEDSLLNSIRLEIDINSSATWNYSSEFIKTELKSRGRSKISGTLLKPLFQGQLMLIPGGRFSNVFPAGDLILERGTIQILDDFNDPQLDIQGSLLLPGYRLNLGLVGKLSDLKIQTSSTPALKRDEIFTLLMDPDYASRLYSSTLSYTGGTGYQSISNQAYASGGSSLFTSLILSNLQARLRKSLGLDRVLINIKTGSTGRLESSYQVGFNLWDTPYPLVLSQNQIGDLKINSAKILWNFPNGIMNLGLSQTTGSGIYPSGEVRFNWSSKK